MRKKHRFYIFFWGTLLFIANLAFHSANWYIKVYGGVGFNAILFTLFSGLDGVESWIIKDYLITGPLMSCITTPIMLFIIANPGRAQLKLALQKTKKEIWLIPLHPKIQGIAAIFLSAVLLFLAARMVQLPQWLNGLQNQSLLFEETYISPDGVDITFPEKKRNLIYITMESMETSFFSKEQGGGQETCLIPNLHAMAEDAINFSADEGVGGWASVSGTMWTTAGILAQASGVPLLMPIENFKKALPNLVTIWDILAQNGYYQTVVMGSQAEFAGQKKIMIQHGIDRVFDYTAAIQEGFIPEDYYVFWGMEDERVFSYAREALPEIAAAEEPFLFQLITMDTHFPGGYLCSKCGSEHTEQYDNVYSCADRQVADFLEWLKQQPFYENTTVIICGDHLSMDAGYFQRKGITSDKRSVYNCIINAPVEGTNMKNRLFSSMDMFPTTLAAIGCTIEGDRLGLGTNLLSDQTTLAEELGLQELNQEIDGGTIAFYRKFMAGE